MNKKRGLADRESPNLDIFKIGAVELPAELNDFFHGLKLISSEPINTSYKKYPSLKAILEEYHSRPFLIAL